mgnify:CR=1 FL=1
MKDQRNHTGTHDRTDLCAQQLKSWSLKGLDELELHSLRNSDVKAHSQEGTLTCGTLREILGELQSSDWRVLSRRLGAEDNLDYLEN